MCVYRDHNIVGYILELYIGIYETMDIYIYISLSLSSSSIGYAMPEGIAEANLQPNVQYPWLGEVQRSLDRGPKQPLIDLTPAYPIQCALVSRENGRMEWTEERLASGDPSFPTSPSDLHMSLASQFSRKNSMSLSGPIS